VRSFGGEFVYLDIGKEIPSPDGSARLITKLEEGDHAKGEIIPKEVYLKVDGRMVLVQCLIRSGSAGWAPDGKRFAINDFAGSDSTICRVYDGKTGKELIDTKKLLTRCARRNPDEYVFLTDYYHLYIVGEKWESNELISLEISGFAGKGSPARSFDIPFELNVLVMELHFDKRVSPTKKEKKLGTGK
jgi:hypothetical protein